jgi:hypothetical protein
MMMRALHLLVLLAGAAALDPPALAQAPTAAAASAAGRWEGAISTPGAELKITVTLTSSGGGWSGTIDIPAQGARGLALGDVTVQGSAISFTLPSVPGAPAFKGTLAPDGASISGTFSQAGQSLPFKLERKRDPSAAAASALAGFDEWVLSAMKSWNVPGLAVGVVKDGSLRAWHRIGSWVSSPLTGTNGLSSAGRRLLGNVAPPRRRRAKSARPVRHLHTRSTSMRVSTFTPRTDR